MWLENYCEVGHFHFYYCRKVTVKLATSIFIIVGKLLSSKHAEEISVRRGEARMGFPARLDSDLDCCQVGRVDFHYCRRG